MSANSQQLKLFDEREAEIESLKAQLRESREECFRLRKELHKARGNLARKGD